MSRPSPHRFLSKKQARPKDDQTASSLRRQASPPRDNTFEDLQQTSFAGQFATAPRFSLGHTLSEGRARSPTGTRSHLPHAFSASTRSCDAVEDAPSFDDGSVKENDDEDEMLLRHEEEAQAILTTESTQLDRDEWTTDLPYSPKRRRLETPHGTMSEFMTPRKPTFQVPTAPASTVTNTTPRFVRAPSLASGDGGSESSRRPAFLPPPVTAPEPASEPLPEAFSPQRRGQKFVPGGLAATVQQWIVQAGQSAALSRRGLAYLKDEDHLLQLVIHRICGRGPFFANCTELSSGRQVKIILSENSKVSAPGLKAGDKLGIRAPMWDIDGLQGETWAVGVDWRLLS